MEAYDKKGGRPFERMAGYENEDCPLWKNVVRSCHNMEGFSLLGDDVVRCADGDGIRVRFWDKLFLKEDVVPYMEEDFESLGGREVGASYDTTALSGD
ncbi:hypothetical protein PIB30_059316 [Stylosanthes scabra]|uniref:Uncharacterized protein n=1 Tax=Stylosanthes scabra TaxID=79078 RepID=A0ABU6ZIX7_9FABA|nr:hypothetical protein [Stylosanthes scabra]